MTGPERPAVAGTTPAAAASAPDDDAGTRVAVVGVGRMGAAMVARLRGAGHPVTMYNRTRSRAADLAATTGALVAGTAAEAVAGASAVLVSLADDAALDAVYRGADGIAAGVEAASRAGVETASRTRDDPVSRTRDGVVVVDTSTVSPYTIKATAQLIEHRGGVLLDAPVSGSVPLVQRGELTFLVGGDAGALDRVRPVLGVLATRVFHLGAQGTGATMKLAVNSVVHALNQALAEALVLAEKAGLAREAAYEVFASSAVAAPYVLYKRAVFERPEQAPVAFSLDLVAKDLALIDALATGVGARMDQLATNRRIVLEAIDAGLGDHDLSAVAQLLRRAD